MDILCPVTLPAAASRRAIMSGGMTTPTASATAFASSMMRSQIARKSGCAATRSRVECVSRLIGLKHTLPHSFSHTFHRMFSRTGASKPALVRAFAMTVTRSETVSSGSPRMNRLYS